MSKTEPVPASKYFKCESGVVLTSLRELEGEFRKHSEGISKEDFEFHVKNNDNDYANWIRDVFLEQELSEKIRNVKTPLEAYKVLQEHNEARKESREKENEEKKYDQGLLEKAEGMTERVKKLKARATAPMSHEEKAAKLRAEYDALTTQISDHRKQGKDMFIPSLLMKNIKPKIKYYEASGDEEDYHKTKSLLHDAKKEIEEALQIEEPNLKKEVLEGAGQARPVQKEE